MGALDLARAPMTGKVLVAFTVNTKPMPKERPRFNTKTGRVYTPDTTRAYEAAIALAATQAMRGKALIDYPVAVAFVFERTDSKGDVDNLIKSTLDGMSSVRASKAHMGRIGPVLKDDVLAVDKRGRVFRNADADRVSVVVLELDTEGDPA